MVRETCDTNLGRDSCILSVAEVGEYDAVAVIRMVISSLSILGTLTIIILAIGKKQVFKSKIHPIFILSLADFILACLWITGAIFWLGRPLLNNAWCLVVSLLTVIVQCITINLTLIYALLAHHALKRADLTTQSLLSTESESLPVERVWRQSITVGVYATAWVAPVIIVILTFAIVVGSSSEVVTKTNQCSCWCLPTYGNILPAAYARDGPTAVYMDGIHKLLAAYGTVISVHYLVVFVLLIIIYRKILGHIQRLRQEFEQSHRNYRYGVATMAIVHSQSNAKTRVLLYLLVFFVNGFFNFLLSLCLVFYEAYNIQHNGKRQQPADSNEVLASREHIAFILVLMLQSLTLPLQGFLNTIVYGWTRRDFLNSMALVKQNDLQDENSNREEQEYQHERAPRRRRDKTMTSSLHQSQTKSFVADINVLDSENDDNNMTDTDM